MKQKAFTCDITAEQTLDQDSVPVYVEISPTVRLVIIAHRRESERHGWVQGDIGPKAAAQIQAAILKAVKTK